MPVIHIIKPSDKEVRLVLKSLYEKAVDNVDDIVFYDGRKYGVLGLWAKVNITNSPTDSPTDVDLTNEKE